ncbi:MAG: hypothetical protein A3A10_03205 [Candidatus Tagabacteria bacterium RIFCSPLOWO2_01_FULL_42_9]|uniref:Response regulatory domain-containing protein n=1 Tax=Candidatus Tagabacteria bacterium RIFCSPLOWO2_01_FULL_42_9 TaxID=1802296 RepID=A0A1G2LVN4_9BACT|nr:MAG: hypothetical protein A3A10_03205 [Candidatus Tagabacteria bacterium RIFCSPLOWO2_01_FULL_42_9]
MNILVIEDDKLLTDLIIQRLSREKFDVRIAVDAQEGLKFIGEKRPDLILLDLILPGLDGFGLLAQIRENPKTASIPVIVLSNISGKEDIEHAMSLGAADFLIKADFSLGGIVDKIKIVLSKKQLKI